MDNIVAQLKTVLGSDRVLTGTAISVRNTSYWDASPMQGKALLKVTSTEEVSTVLRLCHRAMQPVVVLGGNTGTVQGQHSSPDEIILSLELMNAIEEIDPVGCTATVQAGCILETLQNAASAHNLLFALDLGARGSCTIGGNVATNAGGLNVIRYGMMRELTLGLEAVLPDGTVISSMNTLIKNNTGYDLKQLFIGAEGTLGVVTRVVVKLHEKPVSANTALFACDSFDNIVAMHKHMSSASGGILSSYEFMGSDYYRAVTVPGNHRSPISRDYPCYGIVEFTGADHSSDSQRFQQAMEQALEEGIILDAAVAQSEAERKGLWAIRENFEILLKDEPYFNYDVSLPIKEMEGYIQAVGAEVLTLWPNGRCAAFAHVGDNNLHLIISPMVEEKDVGDTLRKQSDNAVYQTLSAINGAVSAEHGIGFEKKSHLEISRNTEELALMRLLKKTLDPNNILGPGRIFDLS